MGYREAPVFCRECGATMTAEARSCARCGTERVVLEPKVAARAGMAAGKGLGSALGLYFVLLATMLVPFVFEPEDPLKVLAGLLVLDAIIVGAWSLAHREDLAEPLRTLGRPADWAMVALAVPVTIGVAWANDWAASRLVGGFELFELFLAAGYSLPLVLALSALQPAVIEELAFRGILFERLSAIFEARTAIVISAALFAILHLSLFGAVFLLVLGLITGVLRWRSGSIYPGIALHLLHNAIVIGLVAAGWW